MWCPSRVPVRGAFGLPLRINGMAKGDNKKTKEVRKPKASHNVKAKTNASQPSLKTGKVGGLEHLGNKPKG